MRRGAACDQHVGRRVQVCLVDTKDLVEEQRAAAALGEGDGDPAAAGGIKLLTFRILNAIGEFK